MTETMQESRTIATIRTETKVAVIVGLCLIGLAAYFYFTPVYLLKPEGGVFACGTAASPNADASNICGPPESVNQARAIASLGVGVMIIILGFAFFGTGRARNVAGLAGDEEDETRSGTRRRQVADEFDRDEDAPPTRRSRREQREARGAREREAEAEEDADEDEPPTRRSRASLRDDDFDVPSRRSRRRDRDDDDWSSDGWR